MVTTIDDMPRAYRALLNATDGIVHQVVELHQPTNDAWRNCASCNPDCDPAECWTVWPCPTTRLIAEQVGVSLREDDHTIDATPAQPRPYVVDLSTGNATGGPAPGTVQHYNRQTGDLQTHTYAPNTCTQCAELRDTPPHEITTYGDLAQGERTYIDHHGQTHTEPTDR